MSEPRVIKKYPNRRLYDTVESRYITLADVRRLVVEKIDFVVVDKKINTDITRSILLQVISEQEHEAEPILSQDFMVNIIRSYGSNMQSLVSGYLEQSMKLFMSQQQQIRERVKTVVGPDALETIANVPNRNYSRMRAAQDEVFKTVSAAAGRMREMGDKDRDEHAEIK
jgi:polyhydroxyalkanoate synthesis repressor PhaR